MQPATANAAEPRRLGELDGLRGLAIALVLLWHYVAAPLAVSALRLAWTGVDLFFVLSGFLIGGILLDQREAPRYYRAFYARRCLRILPLYVLWVVAFFAVRAAAPWLANGAGTASLFASPMPTWSYLSFTQNLAMARVGGFGAGWLGITWSLAIEEHCYLLLPWVVRRVAVRHLPLVLMACGVAGVAVRVAAGPGRYFATYVATPTRSDGLIVGVLCAWMLRQRRWRDAIVAARPVLQTVLGAGIAGLAALSILARSQFEGSPFLFTLVAALFGMAVLLVVTPGAGPVRWITQRPALRALGVVSYGVYLFHQTVNALFHQLLLGRAPTVASPPAAAVTAVAFVLTWGLATLSWRAFERPLVERGRRVPYEPLASPRGGDDSLVSDGQEPRSASTTSPVRVGE